MEHKHLKNKNKLGWSIVKLGEIINYKKGFAFKSENYTSSGVRVIKISDTTESSIKQYNGTYIDSNKYDKYKEWSLSEDDIVISTVGSRPPLYESMVGKVIKIPSSCNNSLLNQNMVRIRSKNNLQQKYLYYLLKSKRYLTHIENICRGNANQVSITLDELFDYKIEIPPLKEQEKIAEILSTWDLAIDKQQQLIEKKKDFQKGLIQRLLSGEVRFKEFTDEWNTYKLKSIINQKLNKNKQGNVSLVLSVTNKKGFVKQEDHFEKQVASKDLTNYKIVRKGEFAYNPSRINVGSIALLEKFDEGLLSPMYIIFKCNDLILPEYYNYWIRTGTFTNQMKKYLSGSVRETLSFEDMSLIKIKIPSLDEQKKISEVLKTADKEIELLEKELEALKLQKKGLMQRLLTGEVRVNVE